LKQDAIRRNTPDDIDCGSFLELHTDYLDGLLPLEQTRVFDAHAASCPSCGRYDRVVRRGLLLARNAAEIEPSADFHDRLMERLRMPEPRPSILTSNMAFMVAAVLVIVCVVPALRIAGVWRTGDEGVLSTEAQGPVQPGTDEWWRLTGAAPLGTASATPFGAVALPPDGSYSPLLIQAPLIEPAPAAPRLVTYPVPLDPAQ